VAAGAAQSVNMAGSIGAQLSPAQANMFGIRSVMGGWNSDQLKQAMAAYIKPTGTQYTGGAATYQYQYNQMQAQYGITLPPATLGSWIAQSALGNITPDQVRNNLIAQGVVPLPVFGGQVEGG